MTSIFCLKGKTQVIWVQSSINVINHLKSLIVGTRDGPQTSEWIKSKEAAAIDSLLLKGKADCFLSWQEIQSKELADTKPNNPLEANNCTRDTDTWLRRECQSAVDGGDEEVAAETPDLGRWKDDISNILPILHPVPMVCCV